MVLQQPLSGSPPPPIVLIVEDDRDTRELYETIFKLEGFWVVDAASAEAAVEQAEDLQPDVIITDVGLTGRCDGVALARRVHQSAKTAAVPVIAVTGRMRSEMSADAEFVEILQKPILPEDLIAATRRVLAASAALRERSEMARARIPGILENSELVLRKSEVIVEKWRTFTSMQREPDGRTRDE